MYLKSSLPSTLPRLILRKYKSNDDSLTRTTKKVTFQSNVEDMHKYNQSEFQKPSETFYLSNTCVNPIIKRIKDLDKLHREVRSKFPKFAKSQESIVDYSVKQVYFPIKTNRSSVISPKSHSTILYPDKSVIKVPKPKISYVKLNNGFVNQIKNYSAQELKEIYTMKDKYSSNSSNTDPEDLSTKSETSSLSTPILDNESVNKRDILYKTYSSDNLINSNTGFYFNKQNINGINNLSHANIPSLHKEDENFILRTEIQRKKALDRIIDRTGRARSYSTTDLSKTYLNKDINPCEKTISSKIKDSHKNITLKINPYETESSYNVSLNSEILINKPLDVRVEISRFKDNNTNTAKSKSYEYYSFKE